MKQPDDARIQGISDPGIKKLLQDILETKRNIDDDVERIPFADASSLKGRSASDGVAGDNGSMTTPSRDEMKHALHATQSEVNAVTEKLRADFAEHRGDMKAAVETLRADMHKASADNIKWVIGTMIALLAVTISVLSFVINNAAKVPQLQQPQQPVIVNVLPSASPVAATQPK